ncbi:MAG: hypothetical protein GWN61_05535 [candidate division Zixibacteria bacterium]|nr:hypothetical protein [Phycisphaerae bacterium]NIR67248.1 hypothetical protein [candidate division Zixibacteria bacterium]NIW45774.1 hypothetical protein [Gammaproteobacteria bacterium]NIS45481.1 hypothetical protein [candidate division Zixibacteria bacterium]NIU16695.1 hypothetical protein [candidate division Zixibacteria bacterium]
MKERQRENARMFLRGRDGILQVCQDLFYQGWTVTMEWYDNPWKDMYHEEIQ